jgi:hypothetical protein
VRAGSDGGPVIGPERRAELVALYRQRAEELDAYAARRRAAGDVNGPEGAEDAELAAREYRTAADELEFGEWSP